MGAVPVNYIELPTTDMAAMKKFYIEAFGWTYTDYGPHYASFDNAHVDGGFDGASNRSPSKDGALIVLLDQELEASQARVKAAGGDITQPIFLFPGGRRFHFVDPSGNELAVWAQD